jgi:type IV pilus assembly protein PilM
MLSGGASWVDGFAQAVEERFGAPVERFDPFKEVTFDAAKLGVSHAEHAASVAAVAVGLALRKAGDR